MSYIQPPRIYLISPMRPPMTTPLASGHTQVPNWLFDLAPRLSGAEFKVAMDIARQTYGWHRDDDDSSAGQIAKRTGLNRDTVNTALARLAELGVVVNEPGRRNGHTRRLVPVVLDDLTENPSGQDARPDGKSDASRRKTRQLPDGKSVTPKYRKERNITTTPLPPAEVAAAPPPTLDAEQQRGGGGASLRSTGPGRAAAQPPVPPETRKALEAAGVRTAWRFASVPLDVARAAIAEVAAARKADDRGALIANLLNAYLRHEWAPSEAGAAAPDDRPARYDAASPELLALDGYTRGKVLARLRAADSRRRQLEILAECRPQGVAI